MSNSPQESEPETGAEPEIQVQYVQDAEVLGGLALKETVTPAPKKRDFEDVTFESFLHPIGW